MNQLLSKNVQTRYTVLLKAIARYIFDKIAQLKEKHVRCNQAAFAKKLKEGYHDKFKIVE